ncbi:FecR family protein [Chitinophaga sp. XS-30]|uniref:FecR family protein n=1 Tax=Chitinophaga sp. XS-30 TaxID=2604421 RepID=UPI00143DAABE|nr:FecR family protein [Chitinophaga sp. XS-30]
MEKETLINLMNKHFSREMTEEESRMLTAFVEDERNRPEVTAVLEAWLAGEQEEEVFDSERYMPLLHEILRADKSSALPERVPVRLWFTRYRAAAAAILFLLCAGGYLMVREALRPDVATVLPDTGIPPGRDKAMLTLGDGAVVSLDSGAARVIQQGATMVTQQGGQLRYNVTGGNGPVSLNTLTTPRGGQFRVVLPDGTAVWLNAASSLRYPTAFEGKYRRVSVTGEAYFEVAANADMPFLVTVADRMEVSVLGTHFNINAYPDESGIHTTLLEGSVRVSERSAKSAVLLKPGQQAQLRLPATGEPAGIMITDDVNTAQIVAWKNGAFDFDGKKLEEVMRQLSRWYDVDVIYEGTVPDKQFWGRMGRDLTLSQCLAILEKMEVRFRLENGRRLVVLP